VITAVSPDAKIAGDYIVIVTSAVMAPLLSAKNIDKHFGGVVALAAARFDLESGEVHALMGENGAGKSTFARVLAGSVQADDGQIWLDGTRVSIADPLDAQRVGIGIIHQELDLFPHLTVGENVVIGNLRFADPWPVSHTSIEAFCRPFLQRVGFNLDTHITVESLSIAQQQLVAIARSLSMQCRILLMDEPTSALPEDAAERLFEVIAQLKSQGVSIVYVSHKLDEIFRLCDRITVLRDGRTIRTVETRATDRDELVRLMVGRYVENVTHADRPPSASVALSVAHLTTHKLQDVSFELHRGEVLGIAGLVGAGRSELGTALMGLDRILSGNIRLHGEPYEARSPAQAQRQGLQWLPEDRKLLGLMLQMSVEENSTLSVLPRLTRWGWLRAAPERRLFDSMANRLNLKCNSPTTPVTTLSGGNQQKVLLARSLLPEPDIIFLDDPTRGIDVGAKQDIYRLIDQLAASGKSLLLVSSELPELRRCSDRILVLNNGRVAGIYPARTTSPETLMAAATHTASAQVS
jgi:ABC-type sugar transport system ATPase subunit